MEEKNIGNIDIVVCNLYEFTKTIRSGADHDTIIENVDIGGPTLIRAAAKNYKHVSVLVDPLDYTKFAENYTNLTEVDRETLARKAFNMVAAYDFAIDKYFATRNPTSIFKTKPTFFLHGHEHQKLRYGENPHQKASVFINEEQLFYEKIQGNREPSYNNILDVLEGYNMVLEFSDPSCAIIKHRTACGVGSDPLVSRAYEKALATDELSAYGGVYCFNTEVDRATAVLLVQMFIDTLFAPSYTEDALTVLAQKEKMLILKATGIQPLFNDFHQIPGGFVIQERDNKQLESGDWDIVSEHQPDENEINELLFAWKVVKNSKSNAIVVSRGTETLGIGSGQTSRVDAVKQAIERAGNKSNGAVLSSDAFFPFRDSIDLAAKAGIKAVIVPKGSIRDQESIDAANEHGISLIHTHYRSFKH
jgi:phosphoribosylaminoimidazolecarboxamide formyltransferase / IMP cyclohydrolase